MKSDKKLYSDNNYEIRKSNRPAPPPLDYDFDDIPTIVIDNGSKKLKVGIAGDEAPTIITDCVLGCSQNDNNSFYVGQNECARAGINDLIIPIERGIINHWDEMEYLWRFSFDRIGLDTSRSGVLFADSLNNPISNREKIAQIMFETFKFKHLHINYQPVLSLYSYGRTTGFVVESGYGVTQFAPILEGNLHKCHEHFNFGGYDFTKWMIHLLRDNGCPIADTYENESCINKMKEDFSFVSFNPSSESSNPNNFELPDGTKITVDKEKYMCPELFFNPTMFLNKCDPIHHIVVDTIMRTEENKKDYFGNIVLSGGNTMFRNLDERLKDEILKIVQPGPKVKVISSPERNQSAWIGGSILASLSSFPPLCVTNEEYSTYGPNIVRTKFNDA